MEQAVNQGCEPLHLALLPTQRGPEIPNTSGLVSLSIEDKNSNGNNWPDSLHGMDQMNLKYPGGPSKLSSALLVESSQHEIFYI